MACVCQDCKDYAVRSAGGVIYMARECQDHREYVVWSARGRDLGAQGSYSYR